MKFQEDIDFTALGWVKGELDITLEQARMALDAYVENPGDGARMRDCAADLHLVHGTLRMVELYGAALVVEEMERVAQGLIDGSIAVSDDVLSTLLRGIVQLPDYLERLQSGHKDIPIILLPLLNDLRAARGEKLLTESVLFSPDLGAALPAAVAAPLDAGALRAGAVRLRNTFQRALLSWIRDNQASASLGRMDEVLERLYAGCAQDDTRRLWWVANGVLDGVRSGAIAANVAIKLLFGKVDREIKRLVDEGEAAFAKAPPRDLTKNLLYYLAHADVATARAGSIRDTYRLDSLLPSAQELEHAHGSISGHNRALLDTVAVAIKEDLLHVKEALDIFLRSQGADPATLATQTDVLDRVADTLGMLGLGVPRRVVTEQRGIIAGIAQGQSRADEASLLDVASSLLYVEASLDDHIVRLGVDPLPATAPQGTELPRAEIGRILDALMREAAANIAQVKSDIIGFVEAPWDHARVEQTPRLLEEVSGAVDMLSLHDAAQLIIGISRFVETELLQHRRVPDHQQLDQLADALSSIEYYLEATREQRTGRERILDLTVSSLTALNYWPLPAATMPHAPARSDDEIPAPEEQMLGSDAVAALFADGTVANQADTVEIHAIDEHEIEAHAPITPEAAITVELPVIADATPADVSVVEDAAAPVEAASFAAPVDDVHTEVVHSDVVQAAAFASEPVAEHFVEPFAPTAEQVVEPVAASAADAGIEQEVPDPDAVNHGIDFGFDVDPMQALDGEIRDIFLEEVNDENVSLSEQLPHWLARRDDFEKLKQIRRSFHTLKGSGRLVGAKALGDFAWKIENMLNRVLDRTIAPSDPVQILLGHAIDALPDLLVALRGDARPAVDIVAIKQVADQLAAGEEAWVNEITLRPRKIVRLAPAAPVLIAPEPAVAEPAAHAAFAAAPVDEAVPQLDAMLFDVLRAEVGAHLEVVDAFVASAKHAPDTRISTDFLHAVHTLNGAIAMVELPQISQALMPLEGYVKRLQAWEQAPDTEGVAAIADVSAQIKLAIVALEQAPAQLPNFSALAGRISELRDALPEPELLQSLLASEHEVAEEENAGADAGLEPTHTQILETPAEIRFAAPVGSEQEGFSASAPAPPARAATTPRSVSVDDQAAIAAALAEFEAELAAAAAKRAAAAKAAQAQPKTADATDQAREPASLADTAVEKEVPAEAATDAAPQFESVVMQSAAEETPAIHAASEAPVPVEAVETELAAPAETPASAHDIPGQTLVPDESAQPSEPVAEAAPVEAPSEEQSAVMLDAEPEIEPPAEAAPTFKLEHPPLVSEEAAVAETTPAVVSDEIHADIVDHTQVPLALSEPVAADVAEPESQAVTEPQSVIEPEAVTEPEAAIEEAAVEPSPEPAPPRAEAEPPKREVAPPPPPAEPEPLPAGWYAPPLIDADLLDIFVQEAEEILDHSNALMARLRETPQDRELVSSLQRDLHTVKGGAHMSGLTPIGDLSHVMEALLEAISEQRREMSQGVIEALEHGFDSLHGLVQQAELRQPSQMPEAQIRRIEALVAADAAPTAVPGIQAPVDAGIDSGMPVLRPAIIEEDDTQARAPQEQIRVRADLLDALVNHAGEVAIYRSRLEQQVAGFRFNLTEFEATVARLREQLRKLELETEVQILSRYQRTDAGHSTFDPLELDRFSQLQQLSRSLSESVSDLSSIQGTFDELTRQSETLLLQQSRVNSDLQEGLMRTRMVPFDSLVPALRRTLRQTATELGKRAQLKVEGAHGEMDRNLLERMKAPFEHMLRNALAHGIETPAERAQANKPDDGTVNIAVSREATEVVLRVSDDGRGLDREAIRRKAVERGLLAADAAISERDLHALILDSGFSTAETVTQLSGRGVGMDVVNNEIKQLGGSLAIDSTPGAGASFTVRLPFTLAVTQAILVRLGETIYAVPMSSVQGVVRIAHDDLDRRLLSAEPTYSYAGDSYVIHELAQLLGHTPSRLIDEGQAPLLMTRSGDLRAAIRVDAVVGSREIVVKSVGPQISSVPGIFGATIMGDGSVVMILDLPPLLRRAAVQRAEGEAAGIAAYVPPVPVPAQKRRPLIMVVDDSITMRKATSRVLERQEMDVITAKDGLDAVEKLQDHIPDLVVLDIEMPRMDGYEFATYMKNDVRTRQVPIIMVTSRTGEKHRQRAREIGVERYLGKPYQEAELLQNIHDAIKARG